MKIRIDSHISKKTKANVLPCIPYRVRNWYKPLCLVGFLIILIMESSVDVTRDRFGIKVGGMGSALFGTACLVVFLEDRKMRKRYQNRLFPSRESTAIAFFLLTDDGLTLGIEGSHYSLYEWSSLSKWKLKNDRIVLSMADVELRVKTENLAEEQLSELLEFLRSR